MALVLPVKASYPMACLIADCYCRISAKDRKAVIANLRVVVGNDADYKCLEKMSREVFKNFAKYLVDFFRFSKIGFEEIKRIVKIDGMENITSALAKGKGVILLSAHIGNWELGGAALSLAGYPVSAVVLTHQNKKVNDFFTSQRLKARMRPIEIGASLRACYRSLKCNGIIALLGDRDFGKSGINVEFFGKTAILPKGPAVLSHREGAAIVPTFMVRQPDDSYRLFSEKPIYPVPGEDEDAAVIRLTTLYTRAMESCISRYPAQWYVFRYLWETDGAKSMCADTVI